MQSNLLDYLKLFLLSWKHVDCASSREIHRDHDEHGGNFVNWIQFVGLVHEKCFSKQDSKTLISQNINIKLEFWYEGGEGEMNDLIWYSWVGGIIIGTMIGSNMVLDEFSRAGPRNVVITGRYKK